MVCIVARFKMIVSDPRTAKASVAQLEGSKAQVLVGRSIGDIIDGSQLGLAGTRLRITGGCDKDGIPMRADIHGGAKKYVVLSGGVGFRPRRPGERRRKLVRGPMITDETYQVNTVIFTGEPERAEEARAKEPEAKPAPPRVKVEEPSAKKAKPTRKPAKKGKKKGR